MACFAVPPSTFRTPGCSLQTRAFTNTIARARFPGPSEVRRRTCFIRDLTGPPFLPQGGRTRWAPLPGGLMTYMPGPVCPRLVGSDPGQGLAVRESRLLGLWVCCCSHRGAGSSLPVFAGTSVSTRELGREDQTVARSSSAKPETLPAW